jgi:PKD repeat protein
MIKLPRSKTNLFFYIFVIMLFFVNIKTFSLVFSFAQKDCQGPLFLYKPIIPYVGQTIYFAILSKEVQGECFWNFGDGFTSCQKSPEHVYLKPGLYSVTLNLKNDDAFTQQSFFILVRNMKNYGEKPIADFTYSPQNPKVGETVYFIDNSLNEPLRRLWQFGLFDFSLLANPKKVFKKSGTYRIKLNVSNQYGSDICSKDIIILPPDGDIRDKIFAKSPALADVQAAITQANPGDTVVVPNGSAVWNNQLIIKKGIILKAQSKGGVRITSNYSYSSDNIFDTPLYIIVYDPSYPGNNEPFRVSGFVFDLNNKIAWLMIKNPSIIPIDKIRLDNNEVYNYRSLVMHLWGTIYGVMDNNIVDGGVSWGFIRINGDDVNAWNNLAFNFGTAESFYFEDNQFTATDDTMFFYGDMGGRYCARYNKIKLSNPYYGMYPFSDMHGNMPNSWSSAMGAEIYENTIDVGTKGCDLLDIRGGKALVYNNNVVTSSSSFYVQIREEYFDSEGPGPAVSPVSGQPQHVSDSYFWGNRRNGTVWPGISLQTLDYGGNEGIVPREDVHFWLEKANFNGSSGIGVGPLSARLAVCTKEGVAWWATDEKKLYRWHNGQWELYYTPYTYPHPLRILLGDN